MSEQAGPGKTNAVRRWWWLAVLLLVAVIVVVIILGNSSGRSVGTPEVSDSVSSSTMPTDSPMRETSTPSAAESELESPLGAQMPDDAEATAPSGELAEESGPSTPLPRPVEVNIGQSAELTDTVTAQIESIERMQAVGRGPGEVSGPALRVTFNVTNKGTEPFELNTTIVTLETEEGTPASPVDSDPSAEPLIGSLAPGKSMTGVYLFLAPGVTDELIRIDFSTSIEEPVLVFRGSPGDVGGK